MMPANPNRKWSSLSKKQKRVVYISLFSIVLISIGIHFWYNNHSSNSNTSKDEFTSYNSALTFDHKSIDADINNPNKEYAVWFISFYSKVEVAIEHLVNTETKFMKTKSNEEEYQNLIQELNQLVEEIDKSPTPIDPTTQKFDYNFKETIKLLPGSAESVKRSVLSGDETALKKMLSAQSVGLDTIRDAADNILALTYSR